MTSINTNTTTTNDAAAAGAGSKDTKAATSALNNQYMDFLKLLTTQLQNQDPTAPTDTNQLTQQIASLNQVQQQININDNLKQLISLYGMSQTSDAVSYIGKQVESAGNQGILIGPDGNKQAAFVYNLPAGVAKAEVSVFDSTGKEIFKSNGTTLAGRNQIIWSGKNTAGTQMPDGVYTFKIKASDSANKDIATGVTTSTTGIVQSVSAQNGVSTLELGGVSLPMSQVLSIRNPGA
ncbi:MAG: hypothetical protein EBR02_05895 [Alphaproteobacteria bacterium]|nr:hypothetical protein [Alphaproteobacteria bacterium]